MNIIRTIIDDCKALAARIEHELGPHVLFTKAGQAVADAKAALEQHPDATAPAAPASPANAVAADATGGPAVQTEPPADEAAKTA